MPPEINEIGNTPEGESIKRVTLSGGGLTAQVLTYGATIQNLRLEGFDYSLVLGAPTLEPYFKTMRYYGALVGRFANRINQGRFSLDGHDYQVATNFLGKHCLHGGTVGTGQRIWNLLAVNENQVILELSLADGDMGFPGNMNIEAKISLPDQGVLQFEITAVTDAATPCSIAHHGYFNLDFGDDITGHELQIDAESYLPVDEELIPSGEIAPVEGTAFDFRKARRIGSASSLDHNFCLSIQRQNIRPVASLHSISNGLTMTVETTEPGLQVYDGARIPPSGLRGLDGKMYCAHAGIALETQAWPDSPTGRSFPMRFCSRMKPIVIFSVTGFILDG